MRAETGTDPAGKHDKDHAPDFMRISDGDKDRPAGNYQHGNVKALRDDPSREHWTRIFNRFFSSETIPHGTKAGDPQPIRKGHAAETRKL